MKRNLYLLGLSVLIIVSGVACKKGENDPLSLSSRTKRLVGTWNLVSGSIVTTDWDAGDQETTVITKTYDGTTEVRVVSFTDPGGTITNPPQTVTYTYSMTFSKDGSMTTSEIDDGDSDLNTGYWMWGGKSKTADLKKKETVIVTITETNDGQVDLFSGTAIQVDGSLQLDRLSKKEMTLIIDENNTYSNGDTYSLVSTLNFEK